MAQWKNPQQAGTIQHRINSRGKQEYFIKGQHVTLETLREQMSLQDPQNPMMRYLEKDIPPYPTPVEFWVSKVAHVTAKSGFDGILESEQFKPGAGEFSWWGLKINKEDILAAEKFYKEQNLGHQAQELKKQEPFLENFTLSPLFKSDTFCYGNYRFTFPLSELMQWYKEQNCGGEEPVLRVYETVTYRQEIMYTVLIHSPENNKRFKEYPLLEKNKLVRYQDGKIIWKAQAICETHWYKLVSGEAQPLRSHQFYVWDHVSLVFHLPNDASFKIPRMRLIEALDACKLDEINLSGYRGPQTKEERFSAAETKMHIENDGSESDGRFEFKKWW
ncbi:uncharacterized protein Hap1MRO34_015535 [Clarias gariepinus]